MVTYLCRGLCLEIPEVRTNPPISIMFGLVQRQRKHASFLEGKMKRTKVESRPANDTAHPGDHLPLDVVATTALHFLEKLPDHHLSPQRAVDNAISFLEACIENIESRRRWAPVGRRMREELASRGWSPQDAIPYGEGIKFITGQTRLDRAQEYYEAFIKNHPFNQKPLTASELTARLNKDEGKGFRAMWLHLLRSQFQGARSAGLLDIKRRKKKI